MNQSDHVSSTGTIKLLSVRALVVRFGERTVLDGLSFDVRAGEIFGLLGPNGSGKSTAFQALAGLVAPASGDLALSGEPMRTGDRRLRARLGVVFQQPSVDPRLTARENLGLAAALYRVPRAKRTERVEAMLHFAELRDRADEPVSQFSGGMRRRLELSRAMLHDPELLLMDEPTTGLDEPSFQRTWARLDELRRTQGVTIVLTTHRPEEAERCDRLAIMDAGRIVTVDTPGGLRGRVAGDVLELRTREPERVSQLLSAELGLASTVDADLVRIEAPRGHALIPRIVETLPAGTLESVSMRRPGLGDAFLVLTGRSLASDVAPQQSSS